MTYTSKDWVLIAQQLVNGQLSDDPIKLDSGDNDWEPARLTATGDAVIWPNMPALNCEKTSEKSHCYLWHVGDAEGRTSGSRRGVLPPRRAYRRASSPSPRA